MVQILASGFKISNADKLALENDLLITPFQWIQDCLKGMINKASKSLIKDYIEELKSTYGTVSTSKSILISQIDALITAKRALLESQPQQELGTATFPESIGLVPLPGEITIDRSEEPHIELLPDGLTMESWEKLALDNFYEDAEGMLVWFLNNKINSCRKRLVATWQTKIINEQLMPSIPSDEDSFINAIVALESYKNRMERE